MKKLKRTFAVLLAAATLVMAFSLSSCGKKISEIDVITSEHYTVSAGMLTYSLYDSYYYYVNYFGSDMMKLYFGIDTAVSLKEQYSDETKKTTWFDVFKQDAVDGFCNALSLCEAALRSGVTLNDVDNKYVESELGEIKAMATQNNMSMAEYIEFIYTEGVTEADVKKSLEIYRLANKMRYKNHSEITVSAGEIDNIYNNDKEKYLCRDVIYFELVLSNETEKNTSIKEYAQRLKNATTADEFKQIAAEFLASDVCVDNKKTVTSDTIKNTGDKDEQADIDKWMFAESTANGATYIYEGNTSHLVYMTTSDRYRDQSATKNIYTILFSSDIYGNDADMKAKADAVYKEWEESGKDTAKFRELAAMYTTDTASVYTGGLYENVKEGDLIDSLNDWLFDETLEAGASTIIKTNFGYHIMVYAGEGEPAWKAPIIEEIKETKTADTIQYYAETYPVNIVNGNMKYVKGV